MFSWFTTESQPTVKPGEIPQISRSLGTSMHSDIEKDILDPIKEDDEVIYSDTVTDTTTSSSSSFIGSITGYWSSAAPSSPTKRLSITRQTNIVINQSGQLFSNLSDIPPGLEVEYVEEKEPQAGLWDFFNHVMNGDEEETPQLISDPSSVPTVDLNRDQSVQAPGVLDTETVLQESPRRRNSVGNKGKSAATRAQDLVLLAEPSTPVQEPETGGERTPILVYQLQLESASTQQRCILCGRNCMTVHSSRSRSRSV